MKHKKLLAAVSTALISLGLASSADAALVPRLGGLAYFDNDTNLTWLADASASGAMTWDAAETWAMGLDVMGVTGWRLPITTQPDTSCISEDMISGFQNQGFGTGCTGSEMGHLYYDETITAAASAPFIDVRTVLYWSGTEFAPDTASAWVFNFGDGNQTRVNKGSILHAWAVQSGDVGEVPVPAAVWLFGSGLLGLIGVARRKSANI